MSDLEREVYNTCLAAELAKVNEQNRNAPHNHPERIAGRASDQTRACMAQLAERDA